VKVSAPVGPLEPGTAGKINVIIATFPLKGRYKKDIEIVTNDPERKDIAYTVQANIMEILSFMPSYVNFGQVKQGSNYVMEILIANNGKEPVTITQIEANPAEHLTISPHQRFSLKQGQKKRLMLTFVPGKERGRVEGSVLIKTDMLRLPEKTIFVSAEVVTGK
jgi:hypothetical protein